MMSKCSNKMLRATPACTGVNHAVASTLQNNRSTRAPRIEPAGKFAGLMLYFFGSKI
jgi:hypothetical protein